MTPDAKILAALRDHPEGVSGEQLATSLAISRAAVWARMESLRQAGYDITAGPHNGYRLVGTPDLLHADDLLSRVSGRVRVIGRDIQVFKETTSTNDIIEKMARDGLREGFVVFAESQTKGRGRLGRKWISPPGKGLWLSVLLRPALRPQETTQLTIASATALLRSIIQVTGLQPQIKWPNDLLIGDRKVAGILTELSAEPDRVHHVTLGIGVDVNMKESEWPLELRSVATSLRMVAGFEISRVELAAALLENLDRDYARICRGGFGEVADEWEEHCTTLGREVTVQMGHRTIQGRAESLDDDGALLVRTEHGLLERVIGGDLTLKKRPADAS